MKCADCIHYNVCDDCGLRFIVDVEDKCNEAKDKSRFVELPCKVGDTFYALCRYYSKGILGDYFIDERQVSSIEYDEHGLTIWDYDGLDFSENVYFTREEAEKALERMKK